MRTRVVQRSPNVRHTIRILDLYLPRLNRITEVLEDGLKKNFADVSIEYVNCPDLTQEPFNLAAPGLCGRTALMHFGDSEYVIPENLDRKMIKTYYIRDILRQLGRDKCQSFIFGDGMIERPSNRHLDKLVMNASFWPAEEGITQVRNKSCAIFANPETKECNLEMLSGFEPKCTMQGTFFFSQGVRGNVLKVHVKKYLGPYSFIQSMRYALQEYYGERELRVGLGGVSVSNAKYKHDRRTNHSEHSRISDTSHFCNIDTSTVISTINTRIYRHLPEREPPLTIDVKSTENTQFLYHLNKPECPFPYDTTVNDIEFIGYFFLAGQFYQVTPLI